MKKSTTSHNPKNFTKILALLLVSSAVATSFPSAEVSAATSQYNNDTKVQSLQDQMSKISSDIKKVQSSIATASKSVANALEYKAQLDREMTLMIQNIDLQNELIQALSDSIAEKENEIVDKQSEYDQKYELFKERLRVTHEDGDASYIAMLFGADSLSDFLSRIDRIGAMLEYDNRIMNELKNDKNTLSDEKTSLESMKAEQVEVAAQLALDQAALETKRKENEQYISNLNRQIANNEVQKDALQAKIEEVEAELEARIKELEEEEKKKNSKYVGGAMCWPVPVQYTRITSECGWRTSPLTGKLEYHNGADIPVPYGTDIYAANDGTVVTATEHWSYGNYVMIDHGGGIYTLYAHNSKLCVKVGDKVKRGQVIAKAGSTGQSTGNHCHFSIRKDGVWINHREYFPD